MAQSLELFYPECRNEFMCPTCLARIPTSESSRITVAHILPRAAGGGLKTLLCAKCNNGFGARQDRWMGELLRISQATGSIIGDGTQAGYFEIGGIRVGGRSRIAEDGGLDFLVATDRTSREALAAIDARIQRHDLENLTVTIPLPLLANKRLVSCGFLTAAYLLWFKELGYSWALQGHLDPVREQIQHPDRELLPAGFSVWCSNQTFARPWIGIGRVAGELALLAGLADEIVFLPPFDCRDFYTRLPLDYAGMRLNDCRVLQLYTHHAFDGPLGIMFDDRWIIAPDVLFRVPYAPVLYYPPDGGSRRVLRLVSKDEYDGIKRPTTKTAFEIDDQLLPRRDTGRP